MNELSNFCTQCNELRNHQLLAAEEKLTWDIIQKWKEGLNWSQMQHALDPNRLESMLSMVLVQTPWVNMSNSLKKKFAVAYGFRHEHTDMTPVLGFDIQANPKIWWNTFTISMRMHVVDPHQIFPWSLELCATMYDNLDTKQKGIVDEAYNLRHREDSHQHSGSDSEVHKQDYYVCTSCGQKVNLLKKLEHEKIHKTDSTSDSEISKATRLASDGFLAQDELKQGARTYTPEELGYVESSTPKQCGTCEYFKKPNICTFPMSITVKPVKGCCNKWEERKPKEKFATLTASLESVSDCGQYATYFLLAGDQVNGRGWGVTGESIPQNIGDFKGKPFVVTTSDWIQDSPYGKIWNHPSTEHWPILGIARAGSYDVNDKKLIFGFQDKFRTGEITEVFFKDGSWRAIVKKDLKFKDMPWPPFCSPAIYKEDSTEQDGALTKWTALHLAGLDAKPAYGNIAILHGTCNGNGTTCSTHLKTASKTDLKFIKTITAHKINMTLSKWRISNLTSFSNSDTQILKVLDQSDLQNKKKKITPFEDILKNVI